MKSIDERIENIFKKTFDDNDFKITDDITPDSYQKWDSIHTVFIMIELEKEFNTTFSTQEVADFTSIGKIIGIIQNKLDN